MKFFKKVGNWFKLAFANTKKFIQKNVAPAIKIVNAIKTVVDNPLMDIAVALTATKIDDKALKLLRVALVKAIDALEIQQECGALETEAEKIACYIDWVRNLPINQRNAMYAKTAALTAQFNNGEAYKEHEVDLLVQLEYSESKIA